ncbi:hypothetical protein [Brachybacterium phenoliresistens]|uniref:hypothetical protein n=1 Tax=Brachybacterium phenoliresistens TaxID=396014 RepID=UPI0012EB32D4|nr:hypothetical protein [Brachybacterium phenoliresistens]
MTAPPPVPDETGPGLADDPARIPSLAEVRTALRSPDIPLPAPRSVPEAAHRVRDLIHAERFFEARYIADSFAEVPAPAAERASLLQARIAALAASGLVDQWADAAAELVGLLRRSGHPAHAAAAASVVAEALAAAPHRGAARRGRPGEGGSGPAAAADAGAPGRSPARGGRRRGEAPVASEDLLRVVRALEIVPLGEQADPAREARDLRRSLESLPRVQDQLLGDPVVVEMTLRMRSAQALEGMGDRAGATRQALDVLELAQTGAVEGRTLLDPQRAETAAHAVLARTLAGPSPLEAVRHALAALRSLRRVDDPVLRIGIITDLLRALMRAELADHAGFVSGRLAALQRGIQRDAHRVQPLLAVATQRIVAQRFEAAAIPVAEVRRIAQEGRDRRAAMEASRLSARIHQLTGDAEGAMAELRRMAADARWLADDLDTSGADRARLIQEEIQAQALVLRHAVDLGERRVADAAAAAMERRTRPGAAPEELPAPLMWDYRVDARVGRVIAAGVGLARGDEDVTEALYEERRREAIRVIGEVPAGHEERARYWAAYLDDRHATMLASRGEAERALRAARRALAGWEHLGRTDDAARLRAQIAALEA